MMKKIVVLFISLCVFTFAFAADKVNVKAFELLNLDGKGLEKVKRFYKKGNTDKAAVELLKYFRTRKSFEHPDLNLSSLKINETEQKWADDGLKHVFFAHKGYQPSYFYGDDIDWTFWPVKDNELRWQLHRTKWWQPMGKAYFLSKDEKYAEEWTKQYLDWIKKNPLTDFKNRQQVGAGVENLPNSAYAWRPLEVSHRIQDQISQFMLFIDSKYFTPAFLTHFIVNYDAHVKHILENYSEKGNHLLFEAQRVLYAGTCFPEFKDALKWRESGISILNEEINTQVYPDGGQFELDLGYHLAAINIFAKALRIANLNGFGQEFPSSYSTTIHNMIIVIMNTYFPDYSNPMFSDAKFGTPKSLISNYKEWSLLFPNDEQIKYFATQGKKGTKPAYLSKAFKDSGFYVFRNGWNPNAIQMTLKAGPAAYWHNQPDNGTFELYVSGRNFFPDSGSYVYGGNEEVLKEREWFRQTCVHNTLTLDNENLNSDSHCLFWNTSDNLDVLVYENNSYENLTHKRTVFFVDKSYFVIYDEAIGEAKGSVNLHYNFLKGDMKWSATTNSIVTPFESNNLLVKCFGNKPVSLNKTDGYVSYEYRLKERRDTYTFSSVKDENDHVGFVTILLPFGSTIDIEQVKAEINLDSIVVKINNTDKILNLPKL